MRFWGSVILLVLIAASALAAPLIAKYQPDAQVSPTSDRYLPPSSQHWFGTDQFGRDVFARALYGGRVSLFIAVCVVTCSIFIGTLYGAFAGFFGGRLDQVAMRFLDMLLAFPLVFLAVTCMALFGSGLLTLVLVLTLVSWMDVARLVRAEIHSLKQRDFVLKARSLGLSTRRILLHHIIPNVAVTVVAIAVLRAADVILIESALSFLGLGVQPPMASWGSIINDGKAVLSLAWWLTAFPGLAIILTIISLHVAGESLQIAKR